MTPSARLAAAIEVLDSHLAGAPAEQVLTRWARAHRFAGSSDRVAIRDTVYAALRCRRSFSHLGGGATGRALVLGGLRAAGVDPDAHFTGIAHAPPPLSEAERRNPGPMGRLTGLDCPDWLAPALETALDAAFEPVMQLFQHRAPVFLRVNGTRTGRDAVSGLLARNGIAVRPVELAETALEVVEGARRIQGSQVFADGLVELQDAASQAVVLALPLSPGMRVLDLCAGGGGKTLAMAARTPLHHFAHDAHPRRMADLPARAARAGVTVTFLASDDIAKHAPFDLILADVPCSGSGSWRRSPEGKWTLTPESLASLLSVQSGIMDTAARALSPGGTLAYVTCSMLTAENEDRVKLFLTRHPQFRLTGQTRFSPLAGGDGFFLALLRSGN